MEISELEDRIEALQEHILRLDECIVAISAMANSPLGSMSCNFHLGTNAQGRPYVITNGASTLKRG